VARIGGLATSPLGRRVAYGAVFLLLVGAYTAITSVMWSQRTWSEDGDLSYHRPAATAVLHPTGAVGSIDTVKKRCVDAGDVDDPAHIKVVAATVDGTDYYACYQISDGKVFDATVIDVDGTTAPVEVVKHGGAWRWVGLVKTPTEVVLGAVGIAVIGGLYFLYYRRDRPAAPRNPRWWQTWWAQVLFSALCLVQPLSLLFRRKESGARRLRLFLEWMIAMVLLGVFAVMLSGQRDGLSDVVLGFLAVATLLAWGLGLLLVAPPRFGRTPDGELQQAAPAAPVQAPQDGTRAVSAPVTAGRTAPSPWAARVRRPGTLPSFKDVGGMEPLKHELDETLGLLLAFDAEADRYRISFNGILLHGDPGVGKSFLAQATAGEFGLNFLPVSSSDLISKYVGESAQNVAQLFREAARNVPCLLFFDEFDSIAERRDEGLSEESTRVVNQLLQSLEEWRSTRELVVMAATNHLDRLDPAVVRAGRFDRHIRVDLPDQPARIAILTTQLAERPLADDVDLDDIARRLAGRTPAVIGRVANGAALTAFQQATQGAADVRITHQMLRDALASLGGKDRPTVEDWTWDRLVLAPGTKAELQQVQALVKDPDLAARYGVTPPSGLLLSGPPGTGKTTIARVFAAQSGCSFYPQTAADLTSKWVGESEASVSRLFARARDNAPSIIFIDEIDAIASARSDAGSSYLDRTLTQLLTELDGLTEQRGVFVLAATNRPETLDPALLRGGRLSRTIWVPLPDESQRRELLGIFSAGMPLDGVDLDGLARQTDGLSGADLEALCQQAALTAMTGARGGAAPAVDAAAFARALAAKRVGHAAPVPAQAPSPAPEAPPTGGYL
jgi:transitional endoplasmic reticulum ATPase